MSNHPMIICGMLVGMGFFLGMMITLLLILIYTVRVVGYVVKSRRSRLRK